MPSLIPPPLLPFVTTAAFRAHPTYLDAQNLRSGVSIQSAQDAELLNIILMSSSWATDYCNQPLEAHQVTQNERARYDRDGNLKIRAKNTPVIGVASLAYGYTPTALTTVTNPTWWDDDGNLVFPPNAGAWSGSLSFTSPYRGGQVFTTTVYTAGFVNAVTTASSNAGDSQITVNNVTGMVPGGVYRIWEPGVEEYVTVSPTWTPSGTTTATTIVPLAAPMTNPHTSGAGLSGMPPAVHLAIINYTVAQLMRPDTSKEDAFPDTSLSSGTRQKDSRQDGSGLVKEACRLLNPYRRVVP